MFIKYKLYLYKQLGKFVSTNVKIYVLLKLSLEILKEMQGILQLHLPTTSLFCQIYNISCTIQFCMSSINKYTPNKLHTIITLNIASLMYHTIIISFHFLNDFSLHPCLLWECLNFLEFCSEL